jgi:hypothetical protein
MEDGQCIELEQGSTTERHTNLSSVMEEIRQTNETQNKHYLGGNPRYNLLLYFNFPHFNFNLEK